MITYYISGATGHLGRNIILQLLLKNDCRVVAFVLPNDKHRFFGDIGEEKITFVEGNLLEKEDVDKFLKTKIGDINYVIHFAGLITIYKKFEEKVYNVNVNGTKNMVDCSIKHKVDKFIYISSVDAIPKPKKPLEVVEPISFDENKVTGCYGYTKAIASQYVLDANKKGLKALTIHPSALLGPNDLFGGPINLALTMFAKGKLNAIVTGGYDLVDVRDVASGIIKAIDKGTPGEAYILCGTQISIKGLINLSSEVTSLP